MPSFSSILYDCATECALRRKNRRCKESFGSYACNNCKLNVNRYIDADPNQVDLFMMQAQTRAYGIVLADRNANIVLAIFAGIVLLIAWTAFRNHPSNKELFAPKVQPVQSMPQDEIQRPYVNELPKVEKTLVKVGNDMRRGVDVNKDGKINCIDAAVLFYKHYPDKHNVLIVLNKNDKTGMHHLFVSVYTHGGWRGIEPQYNYSGNTTYWMAEVWGNKYDKSLNVDATEEYKKYAR